MEAITLTAGQAPSRTCQHNQACLRYASRRALLTRREREISRSELKRLPAIMTSPFTAFACVLLAGFATTLAAAASGPPAPASETSLAPAHLWLGDPSVDLQKALAHREEQCAAWLRWEQATTVGDYERAGTKDPRWDADVRAGLEQYAHALAQESDAESRSAAAKLLFQHALAAGCKDPFVSYVALRLGAYQAETTTPDLTRLYVEAEANLEKSAYSPLRKFYASFRTAEQAARLARLRPVPGQPPPPGMNIDTLLDHARKHLVELLHEPHASRDSVYIVANAFLEFAEYQPAARLQVFAPLEKAFDSDELQTASDPELTKLIEGVFWTHDAWQGRTSKWAKDVNVEGWVRFDQRLPRAAAALQKAYALDPTDAYACRTMLVVELGQGEGRERMETWFRRALDAAPNYYGACLSKLLYLEPKWYGDDKAMLEFGHQCLATANWSARLPFILLEAHSRLATYEPVPIEYWRKPEVWADVQQLYQAALAADPDSTYDRSGYALYAYRAEQWKLADALFKGLGDEPDLNAMQCTRAQYEQRCQRAATLAQKQ